jgi:hypothetical protein
MAGGAKADLQRELGAGPVNLPVLGRMSEQDAVLVLTLFREARRLQELELSAAQQEALDHLPRALRGVARKLLRG